MKCYICDVPLVLIHSNGTYQCPVCGLIQYEHTQQLELELRELDRYETEAAANYSPVLAYSFTAD